MCVHKRSNVNEKHIFSDKIGLFEWIAKCQNFEIAF